LPLAELSDAARQRKLPFFAGRMFWYRVAAAVIAGSLGMRADFFIRNPAMSHTSEYLRDAARILASLDTTVIERMVAMLVDLRARGGRLFILGVGGSAANASHAVNDFRKIAQIESYAPTDNVSELTARTNDEGWDTVFVNWLRGSHLRARDLVLVLSVGGGDLERNISPNLVRALEYSRGVGCGVCGVVGRDGGFTARVADACVIVPTVNPSMVTPHTEAFQSLILHLVVSHPELQACEAKWESAARCLAATKTKKRPARVRSLVANT
jgi:D-sedoheptulose 7-phosphate isomerase